jgi:hypothetical protein
VKRPSLIAVCTFGTVVGSLTIAAPAAANECPYGTVERWAGVCTKGQGGAPPPMPIVIPPQGASVVTAPGSFGTINGIPCNQKHLNTCIALSQQP